MGLAAGSLDRRITIMRAAETDDGTATVAAPHAEIGKRWASKNDVSDSERVRAGQQGLAITTRFVVRWDALTSTIGGKDRIICDGRTYEVTGTKESGGRRVGIEISAAEQS